MQSSIGPLNVSRRFKFGFLLRAMMGLAFVSPTIALAQQEEMTIGTPAPAIEVEHWVHDGEGAFPHVEKFEPGKVYVVEFWATWCGPCIMSMPHIAKVQEELKDKGVQFVSVSDEPLKTVEDFLDREVKPAIPDGPKTYRELTKSYCLTTDPDESVKKTYMIAAKERGIPCCFVVGKDGIVEWIGHPMEIDEPLAKILEDKWDREAFGKEFRIEKARENLLWDVRAQVAALSKEGNFKAALEKIDEGIAKADTDQAKFSLAMLKLTPMSKADSDVETVEATIASLLSLSEGQPGQVLSISRPATEMIAKKQLVNPKLIEDLVSRVKETVEVVPEQSKSVVLDNLAHLYQAMGKLDEAIATQKQAVELAPAARVKPFQKYLDELNQASEAGGEKSAQ